MMESFNRRIHFEDAEIFDFLNFLDLGNLHLTSVPPAIGRLVTVDSLNLSGNNLSELPAEIENIRGLRQLLLASN
jgi:Leucine-rich repeat (LRR) protein